MTARLPHILSLSLKSIAQIRGRYWSAQIDNIKQDAGKFFFNEGRPNAVIQECLSLRPNGLPPPSLDIVFITLDPKVFLVAYYLKLLTQNTINLRIGVKIKNRQ